MDLGSIYKSTDAGDDWKRLDFPINLGFTLALVIDPKRTDVLYFGAQRPTVVPDSSDIEALDEPWRWCNAVGLIDQQTRRQADRARSDGHHPRAQCGRPVERRVRVHAEPGLTLRGGTIPTGEQCVRLDVGARQLHPARGLKPVGGPSRTGSVSTCRAGSLVADA